MSAKKKGTDPEIKHGMGQQYITDNFLGVPFEHASDELLLNGNILYIYLENCSSLAKIGEVVMHIKPSSMSTKYLIIKLVTSTLGKFRQLTDPTKLARFQTIRNQSFGITTTPSANPTPSALATTSQSACAISAKHQHSITSWHCHSVN